MGVFTASTTERNRYIDIKGTAKWFRCYENPESEEFQLIEYYQNQDGTDNRRYMRIPRDAAFELGKFLKGEQT